MPSKKENEDVPASIQHPLKWPVGWERTPLRDRAEKNQWKRPLREYIALLNKELVRMKFTDAVITYNDMIEEQRMDPGVAVYFSTPKEEDFGWQVGLGIESPAPTIAEIDKAFRAKAMDHHPDRVDQTGGDVKMYERYDKMRKAAYAWIKGEHRKEHEFSIPCDLFKEVRLNIAGVTRILAHFRGLEELGNPALLERSFRGFKVALPAHASTEVTV